MFWLNASRPSNPSPRQAVGWFPSSALADNSRKLRFLWSVSEDQQQASSPSLRSLRDLRNRLQAPRYGRMRPSRKSKSKAGATSPRYARPPRCAVSGNASPATFSVLLCCLSRTPGRSPALRRRCRGLGDPPTGQLETFRSSLTCRPPLPEPTAPFGRWGLGAPRKGQSKRSVPPCPFGSPARTNSACWALGPWRPPNPAWAGSVPQPEPAAPFGRWGPSAPRIRLGPDRLPRWRSASR